MPAGRPKPRNPRKIEFLPDLFSDRQRSSKNLDRLVELFVASGTVHPLRRLRTSLRKPFSAAADADMALNNLLRFTESAVSKTSLFNDLLRYPRLLDLLVKLSGHSQYFADILVRDPELFRWLSSPGILEVEGTRSSYRAEVDRIREMFPAARPRFAALRRLYRREILRTGSRDILGVADLRTITSELSALADTMIDASVGESDTEMSERFGSAPDTPFAVIGLGKLGGGELNYSSDIDIMFVYDAEGELNAGKAAGISFHEYFNRRAEIIIRLLSENTPEGHLYRVDTRLRPEGAAGPLARSLNSYLFYYESRGDLWERQMLIKARPVGGDGEFGRDFLDRLVPFVYPRTQFTHPAEAVSRIKSRIETEHRERANIKLRKGGIRDIEFAVQTLQLLHGGKNKTIREGNTLEAIGKLRACGLLKEKDAQTLSSAYIFLRAVEHRLQMVLNTQTHSIPADQRSRDALARRMRFRGAAMFMKTLDRHLARVRELFDEIVTPGDHSVRTGVEPFFFGTTVGEEIFPVLAKHGIRDVAKGMRSIRQLMTGSGLTESRKLDRRATEAFRKVGGVLLDEIGQTPVPDMTLANVAALAAGQPLPEQFYGQLLHPRYRELILRVCACSPGIVKDLVRYPFLIDGVAANVRPPESGVASAPDTPEKMVGWKAMQETRAGLMNILGLISYDEMTASLTSVADALVAGVGASLSRRRRGSGGIPCSVFALGKYGTAELGFSGDLDVLFVCRPQRSSDKEMTERFAQQMVKTLRSVTAEGTLYDVDARLRPEGKSSPLVTDLEAYSRYLSRRASLWERQSLTRLRFVWGDPEIGNDVESIVTKFVYASPLPADWTVRIVEMRHAMESRTRAGMSAPLDIKLGPGGMADAEFLAQMIQLRYGSSHPNLLKKRTAEVLSESPQGLIGESMSRQLVSAYRKYREIEKLLRLTLEERTTILPSGGRLDILARCLGKPGGKELREEVVSVMKQTRSHFIAVADRLGKSK